MNDNKANEVEGQGDDAHGPRKRSKLPSKSVDPIAAGLRRLFSAIADEPIPDEFMALLDRIDAGGQEPREPDGKMDKSAARGRTDPDREVAGNDGKTP